MSEKDEFTLLRVIADIRKTTGLQKTMLSELADAIGALVQNGDSALQTNQAMIKKLHQQAALIETLLKPLQACDEAMHYMCEYEIPLSLPYDVKQALKSAKEAGYVHDTR